MSLLKPGLKGAPVKRLQEKLGVTIDGDFGPATTAAVKKFQKASGLVVDGIAGPDTFVALGLPELVLLRVGSRGEAVKKLQADLGIAADGKFGPGTKSAVAEFQTANGLASDGIAGPETLAKMRSFASVMTGEAIKASELRSDEAGLEGSPLPEFDGSNAVKGTEVDLAARKSVWSKVKGWFS